MAVNVETNTTKKNLIFVPRNWGIRYTNTTGEEIFISLSATEEYRFTMEDGSHIYCTIGEVNRVNDDEAGIHKVTIKPAFVMTPGYWNVIRKGTDDDIIDIDNVDEIVHMESRYLRAADRGFKDIEEHADVTYTFAFDVDGFDSRYRITVGKGEFVSLSVKDPRNEGSRKSLFGELVGVDDDDKIHMKRYLANRGIRYERPDYTVRVADLLGIFRYSLDFEMPAEKEDVKSEAEAPASDAETLVPVESADIQPVTSEVPVEASDLDKHYGGEEVTTE